MPVAFDNTVATVLFNEKAKIPNDPATGFPIVGARDRLENLVAKLQKSKDKIVIPTPVIAELLTVTGPDGIQYFDVIAKSKVFQIADLDARAALEISFMNNSALALGDKKDGITEPWQKIKVDRQIVAICKVNNVSILYTDDAGLAKTAGRAGLTATGIHELPLPASSLQGDFLADLEQEQSVDYDEGG